MTLVATEPQSHDTGGPARTLVVLHAATRGDGGAPREWDAYIAGREPVRVAEIAELNQVLDDLGVRFTDLVGVRGCAEPVCGMAATGAILAAAADAYLFTRGCDTHLPVHAMDDAFLVPGPAQFRDFYRRRSATDIAEMARWLLPFEVPPGIFQQPACGHCHQRLAPDLAPTLTWRSGDGRTACSRRKTHSPAPGEPAALITRYALEVREWTGGGGEDGDPARLAS